MCRNIRTLFNFDPPATDEEIQRAFDGLDAFFDEVDPCSSPVIPLDERDLEEVAVEEFDLDSAVVTPIRPATIASAA